MKSRKDNEGTKEGAYSYRNRITTKYVEKWQDYQKERVTPREATTFYSFK
jgi:hypothetical protein